MTRDRYGRPSDPVSVALDRAWKAYDEGDLQGALAEASAVLRTDRGNPDALLLRGAWRLEQGEAKEALEDFGRAEEASDQALLHLYRGLALYDLVRVKEARAELERAAKLEPDWCEAHDALARTLDHMGDEAAAARHYRRAHEIHPEDHRLPLEMSDAAFDTLVEEALKELPADVRETVREVPVMVDARPLDAWLTDADPPLAPDILGLFVGRNLLERSHADLPGMPPAIHLFRRNLLRACKDRKELAEEVRVTVRHEVGHLLGADEETLEDWGLG